ncbi:MAG: PKD domain-containing protein, partial [Pirellulales bacterium]|nr:PKD domain-containing protein [Pirellulales bacterium]
DTLIFNPGDPTLNVKPSAGPPSGQIGIEDAKYNPLSFTSVEDVVIESGPRIDIAQSTVSIDEGDDVSISVTLPNVPQNQNVSEVTWSVNGNVVHNDGALTLALTWDELGLLGVDNGTETYPVLVSATRTVNGQDITTTKTINLKVTDKPPTIDLTAANSVRVADTYDIRFEAQDDGDDAVVLWLVNWGDGGSDHKFGAGVNTASHTYQAPGTYTVTVEVIDDESIPSIAATTTHTVSVTVDSNHVNVGSYTIKEGESLQLAGAVAGNPTSVSWDLNGDGTFGDATTLDALLDWDTQLKSLGIDGDSHLPINVTLRATYANGTSVTNSSDLTVVNVAPTGVLSTNVPAAGISEGTSSANVYSVSFSSVLEPASGDTLTYSFDFGNDGTFDVVDSSSSSALIPATWSGGGLTEDGLVTIQGRVSDQDGGSSDYTTTFTINDVAPTVSLAGSTTATEGSSYELTLNFSDPGTSDGPLSFTIDWGDGSPLEPFTPTSQVSPATIDHVYADNRSGKTTISVVAEDSRGTYAPVTKEITVANVAPVLTNLAAANNGGSSIVIEGDSVALTGDIFDAGVNDSFKLKVDWDDGSGVEEFDLNARTPDFRVVHPYAQDGSYTITATLLDDDGGSTSQQATVVVSNGAPTVTYSLNLAEVEEGTAITLSGSFIDPGINDSHTVSVAWGDGTVQTLTLVGRSFTASHIYDDDDPTSTASDEFTVVVTVTDTADGSSTDNDSQTVDVLNVAPDIGAADTDASTLLTSKDAGEVVTLTATFVDPGADEEVYTSVITWGDGSTSNATVSFNSVTGKGTLTATHTYTADGIYDITVDLQDDDLGVATAASALAVIGDFTNSTPTIADQTFSVLENSASGTVVGTIAASDDGDLTYALTGFPQKLALTGTSDGPADGLWNEDLVLEFRIKAGNPIPTTTTTEIKLLLTDLDRANNATLADLVDDLNTRLAAVGLNSLLVASTGTDVNGNDIGDRISIGALNDTVKHLQITGGAALGFEAAHTAAIPSLVSPPEFNVDLDTGVITLAVDSLDAESRTSYTFLATVTDFWGESDTADITINVGNVNEFAPSLEMTALLFEIDEFSPDDTVIDTATATDSDVGDVITFSIDTPDVPFTIDAASGVITVS